MKMAGYGEEYMKSNLEKALRFHDLMKRDEEEGKWPMFRPKNWQKVERRRDKDKKKYSWKNRGGHVAPLFIPATPDVELAQILKT